MIRYLCAIMVAIIISTNITMTAQIVDRSDAITMCLDSIIEMRNEVTAIYYSYYNHSDDSIAVCRLNHHSFELNVARLMIKSSEGEDWSYFPYRVYQEDGRHISVTYKTDNYDFAQEDSELLPPKGHISCRYDAQKSRLGFSDNEYVYEVLLSVKVFYDIIKSPYKYVCLRCVSSSFFYYRPKSQSTNLCNSHHAFVKDYRGNK